MSRKKALAAIDRPRGGGSYIRRPDGSLEQVAGTQRGEPHASAAADTAAPPASEPDQTAAGGEPKQEG